MGANGGGCENKISEQHGTYYQRDSVSEIWLRIEDEFLSDERSVRIVCISFGQSANVEFDMKAIEEASAKRLTVTIESS